MRSYFIFYFSFLKHAKRDVRFKCTSYRDARCENRLETLSGSKWLRSSRYVLFNVNNEITRTLF
jgi:hypothetical protein